MGQFLSTTCEQSIKAILYLAKYSSKEEIGINVISKSLDISKHSLGKILQILVKAGVVSSKKGPVGGFKLLILPEEFSIMEIVKIFHEEAVFDRCFLGFLECGDSLTCPLHDKLEVHRDAIKKVFEEITISKLVLREDLMKSFMAKY